MMNACQLKVPCCTVVGQGVLAPPPMGEIEKCAQTRKERRLHHESSFSNCGRRRDRCGLSLRSQRGVPTLAGRILRVRNAHGQRFRLLFVWLVVRVANRSLATLGRLDSPDADDRFSRRAHDLLDVWIRDHSISSKHSAPPSNAQHRRQSFARLGGRLRGATPRLLAGKLSRVVGRR